MGNTETMYGHDAIECTMQLWRQGWQRARRMDQPIDVRGEYLGALAAVAATLEGYHTMQEMVHSYYQPNTRAPDVTRVLDAVIHTASGHVLNRRIVEDAAYWRRASALAAK